MDVVVWLRSLGLEEYEAAFRENDIDETVLPSLTHENLKELGVTSFGHRVKLLDAIAALRSDASAPGPSSDLKTAPPAPSVSPEDRAECRQVTVLFSDLVGSTALSARMDPEDLREVISAYRKMRFAADDAAEKRLKRLESLLRDGGEEPLADAVPLLADLLGIPSRTSTALPDMSPQQRKALLFRTFLARFDGLAKQGPVLMVLEDAHWLDPTSRELFDQIVDRLQCLPVLLVATFRPELSPPWTRFPHVTLLTLNRLPQAQVVALVDRITEGKALPIEVLGQILERTEGVPLFTEELTKAVLEAGMLRDTGDRYALVGPLPSLAIPATLHDSLMARLDRLATVKQVAQIGACIGREFDHELLAAVVSMPEAELAAALDRLVTAELVFRRGLAPAASYVFKHALVRDAAYESLLKRRRQDLHARIATSIEALFPQLVEAQPELVARHFGEAGLAEKAIPYWLRAGRLAADRSANTEAIAHLRSGLECAQTLLPGPSRSRSELSLQLALGGPLIATKGFASREAEAAYQRAQELSRELQSEPDLFAALRGLSYVYQVRANLPAAATLAEEVVPLAKRTGDPATGRTASRPRDCACA